MGHLSRLYKAEVHKAHCIPFGCKAEVYEAEANKAEVQSVQQQRMLYWLRHVLQWLSCFGEA